MPQIRSTIISNVRWVGIAQLSRLVVQVISIVIFSRLLAPSDFGLLAMATVVTALAYVFRDMGTGTALIQKEAPTPELVDTVFWFNVVLGLLLAAIVAGISHLASVVFQEPRLQAVLLMLAIAFPISSTGITHLTLMERSSRFRTVAWVEISSSVSGFSLALIAAWYNFGVYSLVIQTVSTAAISTIQFWYFSDWRPIWRWDYKEFRSLLNFSGNLAGFNFINYLANNADTTLVGYFLGATTLGWYNMAYRLIFFPLQNLTFVINRSLFPVYSRQDRNGIGRYYLKTLSILVLIVSPIVFGIWSVRSPMVEVILGEKWMPVSDLLAWFGPTAWLQCLLSSTGMIFAATGRTDILRNLGLFSTPVFVACILFGLQFGIVGVAVAYCFADIIIITVVFHFALKHLGLSVSDLANSIWKPTAIAVLMAAAVATTDNLFLAAKAQPLLRLIILVPAGVTFYVALIALASPHLLIQLKRAVSAGSE